MSESGIPGQPGEPGKAAPAGEGVPDEAAAGEVVAQHPHLAQLYAPGTADPGVVLETRSGMWGDGHDSGDTTGFSGLKRVIELNGTADPPFGGWFDDVANRMAELVPGFCTRVLVWRDEITFFVVRDKLLELVKACRDDEQLRFEACMNLSGVHYPGIKGGELHVVYHLLSYTHNRRITLEVALPEADPHVDSVTSVYPMVNYHERETWDMFGIIFDGHPGLTRILMPDDWVGHPQRKDYPLGGIPVEYKGAVVPPPDERRSYQA